MFFKEILRQTFEDVVSSNGTCRFHDFIDSLLNKYAQTDSFFLGYSEQYKQYVLNEFLVMKDEYQQPMDVYWHELTHFLSERLNVNVHNDSENAVLSYDKHVYRNYLEKCGVVFEESSPTKKRKRYKCSYVPTKTKKTKLYNNRFVPLTMREKRVIENGLIRSEKKMLIEKFHIPMMRQTMMEIYENQWLNNDVIDFYMKMLHERDMMLCVQDKSRRSSHYYSCYFMTLLLPPNGYNYSNVKSWSKKFNVFEKEKIFCPINVNVSHWSMLVIYIQEKRIAYYDSMQVHGKKYLDGALQYLVDESLTMNRPFDKEQWTLITYADGLPLQENDYDCGVFALMYADFITDDLPLVFGQQHMELFRKKMCLSIMRGSFSYPSSI